MAFLPSLEQKEIIDFSSTMLVNAGAGSGKTYTCGLIAKKNPNVEILYLSFNRRNMLDGNESFLSMGLKNIQAKTVHQLALDYFRQHNLPRKIKKGGYKNYDIMNAISGDGISEEDLVKIADYILKYYSCFCNSAEDKIQNTNFKEYLIDQSHLRFYERFEEVIISVATQMFSEMWYGDIELDFDFILKRYERSKPVLDYGMIILDEAQDSSDAILSIFNRQKSIKVAVGDHHQSIYSWRYANNSMRKLDFKRFTLTGSYRFGAAIASVANGYLNWKNFFGMKCEFEVKGLNTNTEYDPCNIAFLSRKNSGLFDKAISMLDEVNANELKMLFEGDGGFNGYLFSESGISIYDVIQIGLGNLKRVRHPTAKMLKTLENVLEFGKSSNDVALKNFCELFDYYGEKLEEKINFIKRLEVKYDDKDKPDIIFSTVHRSKGREYNVVELCNDFLGFDKLLLEYNNPESTVNIEEEINLIYVAVTRAKYKVIIDDTKLPSISDDYKK